MVEHGTVASGTKPMSFRFLKFPLYQDAKKFYRMIIELVETLPFSERFVLSEQLRRAALSVVLNIAEGADRGSDRDFSRYLVQALGSLNEVAAGVDIARDLDYVSESDFTRIRELGESLSRQIGGFRKSLRRMS